MFIPLLLISTLASVPGDRSAVDYFGSPLGIPLTLAGSFAEMRSNHFHSGLDIKTNGQSGYRVYAAAEGWVSRISVSPSGFGNALYVTHPNGYVTVYAHLSRFTDEIASYVKARQYERESFDVNLFPSRTQFTVDKGDIIAFSGNSGGSTGPHLHFEVRNEKTGWTENPLLFGFDIPDTQAPKLIKTKIYAIDSDSRIRIHDNKSGGWRTIQGGSSVVLDMVSENGTYRFSRTDEIEASGRIGFGIQTYDVHDGSSNKLGTYNISLYSKDEPIFSSKQERFSFDQTRFVNAHVDYSEYVEKRRWIQRSFVLPGNALPIYVATRNGLLDVVSGQTYGMRYELSDPYGNTSKFEFSVTGIDPEPQFKQALLSAQPGDEPEPVETIRFDRNFDFRTSEIQVSVPAGSLYEDVVFNYVRRESSAGNAYAAQHQIGSPSTPVHSAYSLAINGSKIPVALRDKAIIASVGSGGRLSSMGGEFRNGVVEAKIRQFGTFTVAVDTIPPVIRPRNISAGKNLAKQSEIRFQIRDDLSGIRSFRGEIDGDWVLFEFDAKYSSLKHTLDGTLKAGSHVLRLEVKDQKGNTSTYEAPFTR